MWTELPSHPAAKWVGADEIGAVTNVLAQDGGSGSEEALPGLACAPGTGHTPGPGSRPPNVSSSSDEFKSSVDSPGAQRRQRPGQPAVEEEWDFQGTVTAV